MDTYIHGHGSRTYSLRVFNREWRKVPVAERPVLAEMQLFESTGCWSLLDVRLHPHRTRPSVYMPLTPDVVHARVQVKTERELEHVKLLVKEHVVIVANGRTDVEWCTWQGIVPGSTMEQLTGYSDLIYKEHLPMFHKYRKARALMVKMQEDWACFDGSVDEAFQHKIDNPRLQRSEASVFGSLDLFREREHQRLKASV